MDFTKRWVDLTKDRIKGRDLTQGKTYSPDEVKLILERAVDQTIDICLDKKDSGSENDVIKADVSKNIKGHIHSQVCSKYVTLWNELKSANDLYIQEKKSDLNNRLRYLLFRMLTGVGIAAIILIMGYCAKKWEIPLPLLRLAS